MPRSVARAALWMSGALLSFSAMAIAGRELAPNFTPFQVLFCRSLVGLLLLAAVLGRRAWPQVRTRHFALHLGRNLLHFVGGCGWFYGLAHLPLAEVFAIEFTVPVWVAVLAVLLLGERLTQPRCIAIAAGLLGVWLILRPGVAAVHPAALVVLGGAFAYAGAYTLTKRLSAHDTPLVVLFHMAAIQLLLALGPALIDWRWPGYADLPALVTVGVTTLAAHFCITRALSLAEATVVVPLDFLRLPLIALVGHLVYRESVDWWLLVGAGVMLAGNLYSLRRESVAPRILGAADGAPSREERG